MKVKIQHRHSDRVLWRDWDTAGTFKSLDQAFDMVVAYYESRDIAVIKSDVELGVYELGNTIFNSQLRFTDENNKILILENPWKVGINEINIDTFYYPRVLPCLRICTWDLFTWLSI